MSFLFQLIIALSFFLFPVQAYADLGPKNDCSSSGFSFVFVVLSVAAVLWFKRQNIAVSKESTEPHS